MRRLAGAWVALACGCGRLGFDAADRDAVPANCWAAWRDGTIGFGAPRRLTELGFGDVSSGDPSLSADGLSLYVTHDDGISYAPWVSVRATLDGPWGTAVPIPALDSPSTEYRVTVTADELTAVMSSGRAGGLGQDLWASVRATTAEIFPTPSRALLLQVDTAADEYDPEISADGKRLYFAPQPTLTTQHIAYADRANATSAFGPPIELTELTLHDINADPSLSPDQTVMLLAAHDVPAVSRLYYAMRADAGATFGAPVRSPGLDVGAAKMADGEVSSDGCEVYFGSNVDGAEDIYVARAD